MMTKRMLEESLELKFPSNRPHLGTFADAPKYMQDNEYIVKGYRIGYGVPEIFKSLVAFHNETINIWSHLLGTLIFIFLIIYVAIFVSQRITDLTDILVGTITTSYSYASATLDRFISTANPDGVEVITDLPKWPLYVHIGSAIFCLMCSSTFHLFHCYGEKLFNLLSRFDYSGIAILICGSTYPPIIYGFACTPFWRDFYFIVVSSMCLATLVFTLLPGSDSPKFRKIKGTLYITVGLLAGGVSFHGGLSKDPNVQMDMPLWALGGAIYISGSILYILRFPEKLSPGKFDYVGASHQLLHLMVLGGALTHFAAALISYGMRKNQMICINV